MDERLSEDWQGWSFQPGTSAHRKWIAINCDAAEVESLAGVPRENDAHAIDVTLLAGVPTITRLGPTAFAIDVDYKPLSTEGGGPSGSIEPARWRAEPVDVLETTEIDAAGWTILNTAGMPFDPPAQRVRRLRRLTARIFQRQYAVSALDALENHLNAAPITIPSIGPFVGGVVDWGCLLFQGATLDQEVSAFDVGCWVTYSFLLAPPPYKHWWRLLSTGYTGFYLDPNDNKVKPGKIWDGKGEVTFPVRLDRNGKPMIAEYTVFGKTPQANPKPIGCRAITEEANGVFLEYVPFPLADLSQLLPFTLGAR